MLKLMLTPKDEFLHDELKNGKAEIQLAPAGGEGVLAITAKGSFRLRNTGNAVDAVIVAAAKLDREVEVENPAAITAAIKADVVRRVAFAKGQTSVVTDIKVADAAVANVEGAGITAASETIDEVAYIKLTRTATDAAVVEVTFKDAAVATGVCEDELCNGTFYLRKVGNVHVNALCNWSRNCGLKRNGTHFLIRAVDPHTKVISLEALGD